MKRRDFLASALLTTTGLASSASIGGSSVDVEPLTMALSTSAALDHSSPISSSTLELLTPRSDEYEAARRIFNAGIALRPAVIARCFSERDVVEAVAHAREHNFPVAVKSGGHSFEGFCLNEGGLVVDVSGMKRRELESGTQVFTAGPGCVLMEVNDFLLPRGRLLPAGSCGRVGLAGLTLGGGYGFFSRRFGLTCDHLLSVRLVDGSGRVHDSQDDPELLWACRGGGNGHFGVVTEMRFRTQPAPAEFRARRFRARSISPEQSCMIAEKWFAMMPDLPNTAFSALVSSGRAAYILVADHGETHNDKSLANIHGKLSALMPLATPVSVKPLAKALPTYYAEMKPTFFKNGSAGFYRDYEDLRAAMPEVTETLAATPGTLFQINTMGGAIPGGGDSACPHRECGFLGEWQSFWEKPEQASRRIAAVEKIRDRLTAAGIRRHYANYPDKTYADWPEAYYGRENYTRLQALKRKLDPDNRFQHPQSVRV